MGRVQALPGRNSGLPEVSDTQEVLVAQQTLGALLLDVRRDLLHRMFSQGLSLGASPRLVWTQDELIRCGTATIVLEAVPPSPRQHNLTEDISSLFLVKRRQVRGGQIVIKQVQVVLGKWTRHSLDLRVAVARATSRTEWQRISMWFSTSVPDQSGPTISPSTTSSARFVSRVFG